MFHPVSPDTPASEPEPGVAASSSSDVAFSPAVKAIQSRKGSRFGYAAQEAAGGPR